MLAACELRYRPLSEVSRSAWTRADVLVSANVGCATAIFVGRTAE